MNPSRMTGSAARAILVLAASLGLGATALFARPQSGVGAASPTDSDRLKAIDAYLAGARADLGVPGLALVVVQGDQVVHELAIGQADDSGRPVTAQTPFLLASLTEPFTATARLQQVEAGKVDLDAPVQRYLPWFTVADQTAAARITIRMLLNQTSGLTTREGTRQNFEDDQDTGALERGVRRLASVDLTSEPGKEFHYSNANYDVLALVVQTVSGMPFDQYLEQRIYAPLSMTHSHATRAAALADGVAAGYLLWWGATWRQTSIAASRIMNGAGTTYASGEDLGHWLVANMNGGRFGASSILTPADMSLVHTPAARMDDFHSYAMGWQVRPLWEALDPTAPDASGGGTYTLPMLIEHSGSWPNAHTYIGFVPTQGWGFALLVNAQDESRLWILEQNVLRLLAGRDTVPLVASGDLLVQFGYPLAVGLLVAELVSLFWSARAIWRLGRSSRKRPSRRRVAIGGLLALALDVLVLWLGFVFLPDRFDNDLSVILRGGPDLALLVVPTLALATIWGPLRTVLLGWAWLRPRQPPARGAEAAAPPAGEDAAAEPLGMA